MNKIWPTSKISKRRNVCIRATIQTIEQLAGLNRKCRVDVSIGYWRVRPHWCVSFPLLSDSKEIQYLLGVLWRGANRDSRDSFRVWEWAESNPQRGWTRFHLTQPTPFISAASVFLYNIVAYIILNVII